MPQFLLALYLLLMVAAGWRLFAMAWRRDVKVGAAVALVVAIPMLFLLPAFMKPERPFADLLRAIGLGLMAAGALSLSGGAAAAWLRGRRA